MKKQTVLFLAILLFALTVSASALTGENYAAFSSRGADFPLQTHFAGDANGDGVVDLRDAVSVLRYLGGVQRNISRDGIDADGNGEVNLLDVLQVLRYCVGDIVSDTSGVPFGTLVE
ncbi:MAG: hypothetical protein IJS44_00195 [Clostridia bacterium]|nr:hypothetical protein [Clostridia bacterium]